MEIPKIWLWTWQNEWESCSYMVTEALNMWYTHIDTAQIYGNEEEVWKWIQESSANREDFFLTTKAWMDNFPYDKVISSTEESLQKLWTDYVDLLLMHWPSDKYDHKETLDAMMKLQQDWKVKNIWVSNFPTAELEEAINHTNWNIYCNQIEYHVYLSQQIVEDYCKKHWVYVTAYSPLARGKIFDDEILNEIAEKHWKTVSQISLKWLRQVHDAVVIPKTTSIERAKQNLEIENFSLDEEDIEKINNLPKDKRLIDPPFAPKWDN